MPTSQPLRSTDRFEHVEDLPRRRFGVFFGAGATVQRGTGSAQVEGRMIQLSQQPNGGVRSKVRLRLDRPSVFDVVESRRYFRLHLVQSVRSAAASAGLGSLAGLRLVFSAEEIAEQGALLLGPRGRKTR